MTQAVVAEEAHKRHELLLQLKDELTLRFLALGRLLHEFRHREYHHVLGYDSFHQYLGSPEVSLSHSTVYGLIGIYNTFVVDFQIPEERLLPAGRRKLEMLLPVITAENKDEWLSKASTLSTSDLRRELSQATGRPVHEYSHTTPIELQFHGETSMQKLIELKTVNLREWLCGHCNDHWWSVRRSTHCPFCAAPVQMVNDNGLVRVKTYENSKS